MVWVLCERLLEALLRGLEMTGAAQGHGVLDEIRRVGCHATTASAMAQRIAAAVMSDGPRSHAKRPPAEASGPVDAQCAGMEAATECNCHRFARYLTAFNTSGRNAARTSEAPRRLGSICCVNHEGSPARKCRWMSTSWP